MNAFQRPLSLLDSRSCSYPKFVPVFPNHYDILSSDSEVGTQRANSEGSLREEFPTYSETRSNVSALVVIERHQFNFLISAGVPSAPETSAESATTYQSVSNLP